MYRKYKITSRRFEEHPKVNPYKIRGSPKPDSERELEKRLADSFQSDENNQYGLTENQRHKINRVGQIDSKSNTSALKKRDRLPGRLFHLCKDVESLSDTPLLKTETWNDGLKDRKTKKPPGRKIYELAINQGNQDKGGEIDEDDSPYVSPYDSLEGLWQDIAEVTDQRTMIATEDVHFTSLNNISDETQVGYEIGKVLSILHPSPTEKDNLAELVWGFILAFVGQPRVDVPEKETELFDTLLSELEELEREREKIAKQEKKAEESYKSEYRNMETSDDEMSSVAKGISDTGISPSKVLEQEVKHHLMRLGVEDPEHYRGAAEAVTEDIMEITPLEEVDKIKSHIQEDLTEIESHSWKEIDSVESVLSEGWAIYGKDMNSEDGPHEECSSKFSFLTDEVNKNMDGASLGSISYILNCLTEGKSDELWTNNPIIEFKGKGQRGNEWEFTEYGALFTYACVEKDDDPEWIHHWALDPEELSLYERKLVVQSLNELEFIDRV